MFALIGGSGFVGNDVITVEEEIDVTTPYGSTSAPIQFGLLGGTRIAFLRRHGANHEYPPHLVPSRANLWALKKCGVEGVVAVSTVGGIAPALRPGGLAVPDQLIDYTWGRAATYYDEAKAGFAHVDMTNPFDSGIAGKLLSAAKRLGKTINPNGVYACTQGPRLETAAEVRRIARDGADMIGMTLYPECALARELGIPFAGICVSVNHAAGMGDSAQGIDFESLKSLVGKAVLEAVDIVREMVAFEAKAG